MHYNFNINEMHNLKILILNELHNDNYQVLDNLFHRLHILSDYELLKIISSLDKNIITNQMKKKIKTYWKNYLSKF